MNPEYFAEPATVSEAHALMADDPWGAKVISGGTAVVLMMRQGLIEPSSLISIKRIPSLHGITETDNAIRVGATTSLYEVASSPLVRRYAPSVATACSLVGNPRIRNVATLGGNLAEADYASDPPAALAAVGALAHVVGPLDSRTVPVAEFITGFFETVLEPTELIDYIDIPIPGGERREVYLKYRSRSSEDRACVGVAARVDLRDGVIADADVVVAAVGSTLQRVPSVLESIRGSVLDEGVAVVASRGYAEAIDPMDDARGSAWYRRKMIEVFVRRALVGLSEEHTTKGGQRG